MIGRNVTHCGVRIRRSDDRRACGNPSSANGIGMLIPDDSGRSRGMGGAGIAVDDGKNLIQGNPALISSFKDASYGIGVTYDRVSTNPSTGAKTNFARTEPTIIRFVLPLYRGIALGWGLTPYSQTDVKLELPSPDGATYTDTMNSTGGINLSSFQLAASFLSFRAGAAVNYYFGEIKEEWIRDFKGAEDINNSHRVYKKAIPRLRRDGRGACEVFEYIPRRGIYDAIFAR